jgi:hypothetical protein
MQAMAQGQDLAWMMRGNELRQGANRDYAGKLGAQAEFEAQSAAWEAKNAFASHASAMGGIAGMNTGALAPGPKPQDMNGMAMAGMLDTHAATGNKLTGWSAMTVSSDVRGEASFSGTKLPDMIDGMVQDGRTGVNGAQSLMSDWYSQPGGGTFTAGGAVQTGWQNIDTSNFWQEGNVGEAGAATTAIGSGAVAGLVDSSGGVIAGGKNALTGLKSGLGKVGEAYSKLPATHGK